MATYMTDQKRALRQILVENCERAYTVEELCDKMKAVFGEGSVGKSTVYRLINTLVEDGTVKKFARSGTQKSAYQIVNGEHCDCHLHLKCTDCGRLIHLDESLSDELLDKVRKVSDFCVSEEETVLFGKCASCKKA